MSAKIVLKNKAEKSIMRRHPWIFSGAIHSIKGNPEDGDILKLLSPHGDFAARGYYNSQSTISVRVLSWDADEMIDRDFWHNRLKRAIDARGDRKACRLIHAESDYLPGLIVDRYGDWLVLQALTLGIDQRKEMIAEILAEIVQPLGIYERSDVDIRRKEGLQESSGVLWGEAPPDVVEIVENDSRILVDIKHGQKTGFYLDQAANRALFQATLAEHPNVKELSVLNAFSYSGGFTLAAKQAGADQVLSLDSSEDALKLAEQNLQNNGFAIDESHFIQGDVFSILRDFRDQGRSFDVIVLDPPKFASTARQLEGATRGYKDINLLAFQLLNPGGLLWTFSCSNAMSEDLFQKVIFGAMIDAERDGQMIHRLHANTDHPIALTFPEGQYLKGIVCRVW